MTTRQLPKQAAGHPPVAGSPWLPRAYVPREQLWSHLEQGHQWRGHDGRRADGRREDARRRGLAAAVRRRPATRSGSTRVLLLGSRHLTSVLKLAEAHRGASPGSSSSTTRTCCRRPACGSSTNASARIRTDCGWCCLTRWDLALSRLVAELLGQLTVVRGDVLRLDAEETAQLVAEHARTDSAAVCEAIASRSQGWCAAVVLAARAVRRRTEPKRLRAAAAAMPGRGSPTSSPARCSPSLRIRSDTCCCARRPSRS